MRARLAVIGKLGDGAGGGRLRLAQSAQAQSLLAFRDGNFPAMGDPAGRHLDY